jgi:hypothetical protein
MHRRLLLGATTSVALLALGAPVTLANPPVHDALTFEMDSTVTGVCDFEFEVHSTFVASYTLTQDRDGYDTMWIERGIEQDTFRANGSTLVGLPYRYVAQARFDSSGTWTYYSMGGVERVRLPDGSVFWSAGRVDWIALIEQGVDATLTPTNGHSGDLDAFCAALS